MTSRKTLGGHVNARLRAILVLTALLMGTLPYDALAEPPGYVFTPLAFLDGAAPGSEGGSFTFDFEPWSMNSRGEVAFGADVTTGGEGIFLGRKGKLSQIVRTGEAAPGGGTFGVGFFGHTMLNDEGDVAFTFALDPFTTPVGVNAGVYRYSHGTKTVTAVVVPGVTPAPKGGVFAGAGFHAGLNNLGNITFTGVVPASVGPGASVGLGVGVFRANKTGEISSVASPGDPAPGGGTFDFAQNAWINNAGDIAFGAHVEGEECISLGQVPPDFIFCAESVYIKDAATGEILSIAHQGAPAPGGGIYRLAFGPVLNNRGDIVFIGDLTPAPGFGQELGVFLHTRGNTFPVARPHDPMPGGGNLVTASFFTLDYHVNDRGEIAFSAILDTDENADGVLDSGLYVSSHGSLRLVARTGTVIPDVGTIVHVQRPDLKGSSGILSGAATNNRGQVFFTATLTDGRGVLLVATPSDE